MTESFKIKCICIFFYVTFSSNVERNFFYSNARRILFLKKNIFSNINNIVI